MCPVLVWCDETAGQVLRFDPGTGKTTVHCADSGKSNGLMFDREGRLIACCGANYGKQALCEITPDGAVKGLVDRYQGRGVVTADFDRDGDLDVLMVNSDAPPRLYRNDGGNARAYLVVQLRGNRANSRAIGARIFVTAGGRTQMRGEVGE